MPRGLPKPGGRRSRSWPPWSGTFPGAKPLRPGADTPDQALIAVFERQQVMSRTFLAHLESAGRARVLDLHYHDALADAAAAATKLGDLLGEGFDAAAATAAIDRSLRRTRKKAPATKSE